MYTNLCVGSGLHLRATPPGVRVGGHADMCILNHNLHTNMRKSVWLVTFLRAAPPGVRAGGHADMCMLITLFTHIIIRKYVWVATYILRAAPSGVRA